MEEPIEFLREHIQKLRDTCAFIAECNTDQRALILNEILMLNPIVAWDLKESQLMNIESVCVNGGTIQLNCEI